jgi:hypothetical protein
VRNANNATTLFISLLIAIAVTLLGLEHPGPTAMYCQFPGMAAGLFLAMIEATISQGNAHEASLTFVLIVSTVVNTLCYYMIITLVLVLKHRVQGQRNS